MNKRHTKSAGSYREFRSHENTLSAYCAISFTARVEGTRGENGITKPEEKDSAAQPKVINLAHWDHLKGYKTTKACFYSLMFCEKFRFILSSSFSSQSLPLPPLIWVLGGPGSCKASRAAKAVQGRPWTVINFGYSSLSQYLSLS